MTEQSFLLFDTELAGMQIGISSQDINRLNRVRVEEGPEKLGRTHLFYTFIPLRVYQGYTECNKCNKNVYQYVYLCSKQIKSKINIFFLFFFNTDIGCVCACVYVWRRRRNVHWFNLQCNLLYLSY